MAVGISTLTDGICQRPEISQDVERVREASIVEKREKKMEREDVNSVHCDIGRRRKSMNEKEYFHSARSVFDALDNLFFSQKYLYF